MWLRTLSLTKTLLLLLLPVSLDLAQRLNANAEHHRMQNQTPVLDFEEVTAKVQLVGAVPRPLFGLLDKIGFGILGVENYYYLMSVLHTAGRDIMSVDVVVEIAAKGTFSLTSPATGNTGEDADSDSEMEDWELVGEWDLQPQLWTFTTE